MSNRERFICGRHTVTSLPDRRFPELIAAQRRDMKTTLRYDAEDRGLDLSTEADLSWHEEFYRIEMASDGTPTKVVCPESEAEFVLTSVEASYETTTRATLTQKD